MSLTLVGLLIYLVFLIGFAIFSAFGVYHLWQFGYVGDFTRPIAIGYIVAAAAVIFLTLLSVLGSILGG